MAFFSGRELIDIAIGIEKSGLAFYDSVATASRDRKTEDIFRHLAAREKEHIETFQSMLGPAAEYPNSEPYTEDYAVYLNTLVDSAVFKNERTAREMAQRAASEFEAIETGIRAEKDSILFYSAIQDLVRRADAELISRIIKEEKSHLAQLTDLKNDVNKSLQPGNHQGSSEESIHKPNGGIH
jgi:rubrerythrin